jgi:alpha-D-ribose 1-methylphosphonate 5-triphosphate synthase subunit PhnL
MMNVRVVPWLIALGGLAIPLASGGFAVAPLIAVWLAILAWVWSLGRAGLAGGHAQRVALAVGLLPVLFALGAEFGLFLIPADIAWLAIELADRRVVRPVT